MILGCTYLFFEALGSPLRLKIVELLLDKEMSVSELTDTLKTEQSRISHALTALLHCKLISFRKEGKNRIYYIDQPFVKEIIDKVVEYEKKACITCGRLEEKNK